MKIRLIDHFNEWQLSHSPVRNNRRLINHRSGVPFMPERQKKDLKKAPINKTTIEISADQLPKYSKSDGNMMIYINVFHVVCLID